MIFSRTAFCNGVEIIGEETVHLPAKVLSDKSGVSKDIKTIKVYKVKISDEFKDEVRLTLRSLRPQPDSSVVPIEDKLNVNLGMSNVPVLDQGQFSTCSIFAMTALLNANKNAGDFISQQCLLELGVYLSQQYYEQSGWDGISSGTVFVERINKYGAVNKKKCPREYAMQNISMDDQTYWKNSSSGQWSSNFQWYSLGRKNLESIKQTLDSGKRVYIETLLHKNYLAGYPINGRKEGFWALPSDEYERMQFVNDVLSNQNIVGHAVVVTGYSDKNQYIKLRNSWGSKYGEEGEFYMSYDFYKMMNFDSVLVSNS